MAGSNPWRYYVLNHIDEKREIVQFASGSPPRKARMLIFPEAFSKPFQ